MNKVATLRNSHSKIGFVLQAAYFRITGRFFAVSAFHLDDIAYVGRMLHIPLADISLNDQSYSSGTMSPHRTLIMDYFKWTPYRKSRETVMEQAKWYAQLQTNPEKMFRMLVAYCREHRIETPGFDTLSRVVSKAILQVERTLLKTIKSDLKDKQKDVIDDLLTRKKLSDTTANKSSLLAQLQDYPHTIKVTDVRVALTHFHTLRELHLEMKPLLTSSGVTDSAIQYFAEWVRKAQTSQIRAFETVSKQALYLASYIADEVRLRNDLFVDILLRTVKSSENSAQKQVKEKVYSLRKQRQKTATDAISWNERCKNIVRDIQQVALSDELNKDDKLNKIVDLTRHYLTSDLPDKSGLTEPDFSQLVTDTKKEFLTTFQQQEPRLHRQVRPILLTLDFNTSDLEESLRAALEVFTAQDGILPQDTPREFLSASERALIWSDESFNQKLLHVLFYQKIALSIKAGSLSLHDSYRYKSLRELLIPEPLWKREKEKLISMAGLNKFSSLPCLLEELDGTLKSQYRRVTDRIKQGKNTLVRIDPQGYHSVSTPRVSKKGERFVSNLLTEEYVPVFQILKEVDDIVGFTRSFSHLSIRYSKLKADQSTLIAAIIAHGCNIGPRRLLRASRGLNENNLENAVKWYFSPENVVSANDRIIEATNLLSLPRLYNDDEYLEHTSSDGRKVGVSIESLQARYSAKYFGRGKGLSIYSFIDPRQHVYSTDVIESSDREASYVLNGLRMGGEMKSSTHSTDTHGYSEVVFALTHLLEVFFAPRLAKIGKHSIYSLSSSLYKNREQYLIRPKGVISAGKIEAQWEQILRLVATIKLDHATGSQLMLRLNSYSRHPLYAALKEFGRIIKSHFILRYYDEVELRQKIQLLLNRGEAAQRFSRSIFFDNAGQFTVRSKERQKMIAHCQTLIQNAIVHWNYLYVSQVLASKTDEEELAEAAEMIKGSSVLSWGHVNLKGEYDFTTGNVPSSRFDMKAIRELELPLN